MALTKTQKQKIVVDLKEKIAKQKAIIFIDFTGMKVKDLSSLRRKLKAADCELKVAKKTLMGIVFKEAKVEENKFSSPPFADAREIAEASPHLLPRFAREFEVEPKKLAGQVGLVFGYKDALTPAKIVYQFVQTNLNLKILGGFFENEFRELEVIVTLAQLPAREELLARLAGSIQAPVSNFVRILEANIKGLIYVLKQIKT